MYNHGGTPGAEPECLARPPPRRTLGLPQEEWLLTACDTSPRAGGRPLRSATGSRPSGSRPG